ncbi:MAG: hypothetical protein AB7T27_03770 [Kiritimatiellia bacterium]
MKRLGIKTLSAVLLMVLSGASDLDAAWKDSIDWTLLKNELGSAMPDGTNIPVTQVESLDPATFNYFPDTNDVAFAGKIIHDATGIQTGSSYHATAVGKYFYGTSDSAAPGIGYVDSYYAGDWMGSGFLTGGSDGAPRVESNRVQNHSWIGFSESSDLIRRLDYAIDRDGFTCVVGVHYVDSPLPQLLSYSYNAIAVGKSSGGQSTGFTTNDVAGRIKPDIVATNTYTSYTTPMVGGCAVLLMDTADEFGWTNGSRPQTIKALLMAGATKTEFGTNWDRTAWRPLDERFGAGELNIYNSWKILTNGEQNASATSVVKHIGWDYNEPAAAETNWYYFDMPTNHAPSRFSTILTWHRKITDGNPGPTFSPNAFVANLDLFLYQAAEFTPTNLLDHSTSQVDNVEHVFQTNLPCGRYALKVTSDSDAKYALAWYKAPAAIPVFNEVSYLSSTGFVLKVGTSPNVLYGIQATTNLLDADSWTNIGSATPATSLWIFVDAKATNYSCRFYKAFVDPE